MNEAIKLRILLAEDEADVRTVLGSFLAARGCEVTLAEDGVEGLEAVDLQPFDVIVTDVRMPRRDGVWLWREATAARPELAGRFIFISGFPFSADGGSEQERFLAKPFTMAQFWTALVAVASRVRP